MEIDIFKIEEWMNEYCPKAKYDLTSTCIEPLSINDLLKISGKTEPKDLYNTKLTYGEIHGSERLKKAIKSLYTNQNIDNITVTHGAIGANQLVYETIIDKGDEIITLLPAYQQHYAIPKALGADVKTLFLKENDGWQPDLDELEKNINSKSKLICFTNPNNPTGAVISDETLSEIVNLAKKYNVWILCDEAYRGLNTGVRHYSKSIADIYEKGISTGSMSKTYSLPGLRLGWIAANQDLIEKINKHREYNTISISILDDYFASIALENREKIENRNYKILEDGLKILKNWLKTEPNVCANLPQGGTTALVRYNKNILSRELCRDLQDKTGVALLPGETMEMENTVRIGFCVDENILKIGLKAFSEYLKSI